MIRDMRRRMGADTATACSAEPLAASNRRPDGDAIVTDTQRVATSVASPGVVTDVRRRLPFLASWLYRI